MSILLAIICYIINILYAARISKNVVYIIKYKYNVNFKLQFIKWRYLDEFSIS